jgi:hypothetical protein
LDAMIYFPQSSASATMSKWIKRDKQDEYSGVIEIEDTVEGIRLYWTGAVGRGM